MLGMHKGTQGIHLQLRLTACDKKNKRPTNSFTRLVLGFTVSISEIVASSAAVNLLLTG